MRGRRPTTSGRTCSAPGRWPRRSWPRSREWRSALRSSSDFSTFRGRPGIYLEDLFVRPEHRGRGIGKALLASVASTGARAGRLPARMVGARLEHARRSASTSRSGPGRSTPGPSTASTASRSTGWSSVPPCPSNLLTPRRPQDEPLLPAPHRPDGRLRAGRAAAGRRLHQAQHQREPVSAVAAGRRGDPRGAGRTAAALPRPARPPRFARPPRGCTGSRPR